MNKKKKLLNFGKDPDYILDTKTNGNAPLAGLLSTNLCFCKKNML